MMPQNVYHTSLNMIWVKPNHKYDENAVVENQGQGTDGKNDENSNGGVCIKTLAFIGIQQQISKKNLNDNWTK